MKFDQNTLASRIAKAASKPLSSLACSELLHKPSRLIDIYLNALLGKGSGTGWNLEVEVDASAASVHRSQPVLFDVGANRGLWSQGMSKRFPEARIILFDPLPGCQAVIRQANIPNSELIPCAVGEGLGRAAFHFSEATDGSASLHRRGDSPFADRSYEQTEVEITTIDHTMESRSIDFVDFMKMDIEGHELFALRGAQRALAAGKIGALSFEFGCGNVNSRTFFKDFWDLLRGYNYALLRITPSGKLVEIDAYYEDHEYFRGATNYVARLNR